MRGLVAHAVRGSRAGGLTLAFCPPKILGSSPRQPPSWVTGDLDKTLVAKPATRFPWFPANV
jgi:hypothetical protein